MLGASTQPVSMRDDSRRLARSYELAHRPWCLSLRNGFAGRKSYNYNLEVLPNGVLSGCQTSSHKLAQELFMSAPSRRPEIRRRRSRKEKITQLRKRLAAAKTDADRSRLTAKLHKLEVASPGQPLLK